VRAWRRGEGQSISTIAFVPLAFELGEAFQFDWSEEGLVVGGIYYRMQVSHLKLCASRAFWLVAYPSQGHEMLFDAHTRSFAAMGGIARRGIYDNMKTAVDKVKKGKGRTVNKRFAVMCAHYLIDADFCNVASGWEKGVVEKNVQDSRRRIWIEAAKLKFGSFAELNAWLGQRCRALCEEVRHPEHEQFSVAEMLEHERPHLMPMPESFDGYVESPARVSSTCLVVVARNRYSVPCELAGQAVSTRLYPGKIVIVADDVVVASHERLSDRGQTKYDWQHYIPLIQRKPGLEQRAVARGRAGEEGVGTPLAFTQHVALGGEQLVGPARCEFGGRAQLAPVLAQGFDVRRVVFLDGLEESVEPLLANGGVHRRAAYEGHQFLDGGVGGMAQRASGAVDLVQGRGELLQKKDGALRRRGRFLSSNSTDFNKGFVDALDRELGALPAERSAAEAVAECPGMQQCDLALNGGCRCPSRPGRLPTLDEALVGCRASRLSCRSPACAATLGAASCRRAARLRPTNSPAHAVGGPPPSPASKLAPVPTLPSG